MTYQFDPIDMELLRIRSKLSTGQRIQTLLDTRELLVGLKRGRLRRQYPHLTINELNMKVLEEIERVQKSDPDLTLFLDILHKLEILDAPYMVIGGFAATIYGITRTTYDIDIIVDLSEEHIQALADMYPLPRYYADPHQMHNAARIGSMFNIIDTQRGEKADLAPLTMDSRYQEAFQNRTRKTVELPNKEPFLIWCARSEDVIFGKLLAWHEGQSRRHPADIYEMMVAHYWGKDITFDEAYVDQRAVELGEEVASLWQTIKEAAREEVERSR